MRPREVHLVYDAGGRPALLGRTASREAVRVLQSILLEEAEERVQARRAASDFVLATSEEADLERLRQVLHALIPGDDEGPT